MTRGGKERANLLESNWEGCLTDRNQLWMVRFWALFQVFGGWWRFGFRLLSSASTIATPMMLSGWIIKIYAATFCCLIHWLTFQKGSTGLGRIHVFCGRHSVNPCPFQFISNWYWCCFKCSIFKVWYHRSLWMIYL